MLQRKIDTTNQMICTGLLLILVAVSSCKKYLDKKPDASLTVPTSLNELQALLDFSLNMNTKQSPSFGEASGDDYFLLDANYNALPVENQRIYTWNRGDYNFQNDWSKAYLPVYTANYCLEMLAAIPVTPQNKAAWNNVKGSALFFRSYNFFNLLQVYAKCYNADSSKADPGIALRLTSDFNIPSSRTNVQACYEQILQDSKEATSCLPNLPIHVMRPSKAATNGLLARTYLAMRNYDSAFRYADACLQLKSSLMDYNGDPDLNGSIQASIPFIKFNKEIIFYTEMNTNYFINTPSQAKVDSNLYAAYSINDLRKAGFFKANSGYFQFKGSYTASASQYFTGIATDEIWLIRAECHARAGRTTEALNDLNTLLIRRWKKTPPFTPATATGPADALAMILLERRKELYMRGLRWTDIKRLNKEGRNIVPTRKIAGQLFTLQPNASYYALPLPADIIQQSGMQQN